MKRLTTDDSKSILFGLNLFFVKDGEVWIRGGGPEPDYQGSPRIRNGNAKEMMA